MEEVCIYSKGDWIVHSHYSIGQIKGIEVKRISGVESRYYRIQTAAGSFWMPYDQMSSEVLRPISTLKEIRQVIDIVQRPPTEMSANHVIRQNRIRRAQDRNSPKALARIIRDLRARQREKGMLNTTEHNAYRALKQRLIDEWAIVTDTNPEKIESELNDLLDLSQASAEQPAAMQKE